MTFREDPSAYRKAYYEANREREKARARAWYYANRERALKTRRENHKKRSLKDPTYHRSKHLKQRYGMSEAEYAELLALQGGHCALCECTTNLHVDHCHSTGVVRGILCVLCNTSLGGFRDDPERLVAAAEYLRAAIIEVHDEEPTCQ